MADGPGRGAWLLRAACRGTDIKLWFPEHRSKQNVKYREASPTDAICAACPVRDECRAYARLDRRVEGIWAGVEYRRGKPVNRD